MNVLRIFSLIALLCVPSALRAQVFLNGQSADVVLGQTNFTNNSADLGPNRMNLPWKVVRDPVSGVVFVCDSFNNRVLRFSSAAAATNGADAEAVFGQPDFIANGANQNADDPGEHTLFAPRGLALDSSGNLWVSDSENHRVVVYGNAVTSESNPAAILVLGQPGFNGRTFGTSASEMNYPEGISVSPDGTLWVADYVNHRVLRFDNAIAKSNGAAADGVLGQSDFETAEPGLDDDRFDEPYDLALDQGGRLWVCDRNNQRVLRFDNAASKANGSSADAVIGQDGFLTKDAATTPNRFQGPRGVFVAEDGTLWVGDAQNNRVLGFKQAALKSNGPSADIVLGQINFTSSGGRTAQDRLRFPTRISSGPDGSLFVCDAGNERVLRFSPNDPPSLTILTKKAKTSKRTYTVKGSASGLVSRVDARVGKTGVFKPAKGTTSWSYKARLQPGKNSVSAVATGPAGSSTAKKVIIIRK